MKECRRAEHLSQDWDVWIRIPSPGGSMDLMAAHAHELCGFQEVSDASKSPQGNKIPHFLTHRRRKHLRVGHPQAHATPQGMSILQGTCHPIIAQNTALTQHHSQGISWSKDP